MTKTCGKTAEWIVYNPDDIVSNLSCDEHLSKMITGSNASLRRASANLTCEYVEPPKLTTIGSDVAVLADVGGIQIHNNMSQFVHHVTWLDWDTCAKLRDFINRTMLTPDPPSEQTASFPEQLVMSSLREEIKAFMDRSPDPGFTEEGYRKGMEFSCEVILELIDRVEKNFARANTEEG